MFGWPESMSHSGGGKHALFVGKQLWRPHRRRRRPFAHRKSLCRSQNHPNGSEMFDSSRAVSWGLGWAPAALLSSDIWDLVAGNKRAKGWCDCGSCPCILPPPQRLKRTWHHSGFTVDAFLLSHLQVRPGNGTNSHQSHVRRTIAPRGPSVFMNSKLRKWNTSCLSHRSLTHSLWSLDETSYLHVSLTGLPLNSVYTITKCPFFFLK